MIKTSVVSLSKTNLSIINTVNECNNTSIISILVNMKNDWMPISHVTNILD
jgi:hypothetical protein